MNAIRVVVIVNGPSGIGLLYLAFSFDQLLFYAMRTQLSTTITIRVMTTKDHSTPRRLSSTFSSSHRGLRLSVIPVAAAKIGVPNSANARGLGAPQPCDLCGGRGSELWDWSAQGLASCTYN